MSVLRCAAAAIPFTIKIGRYGSGRSPGRRSEALRFPLHLQRRAHTLRMPPPYATSEAVDPISLQPELKFAAVALAKVALSPAGHAENGESAEFSKQQKTFLGDFFSTLAQHCPANGAIVLPENAPFTPDQRKHLNDLFRQMRNPAREALPREKP